MLELSPDEQEDIDDLERRLKLYKQYKRLAGHVDNQFGKQILFATNGHMSYDPLFTPDDSTNTKKLHQAIKQLIVAFPKPKTLSKVVVDKVMSLEEMITRMTTRVQTAIKLKFSEAIERGGNDREQKLNVVISFLAMLELVKQGAVLVNQEAAFADILLHLPKADAAALQVAEAMASDFMASLDEVLNLSLSDAVRVILEPGGHIKGAANACFLQ